jgi:hypothetical protein
MSHPPLAAFLIDNPLDLYSGEVRAYLRQDAPLLALATLLIALAILSLIVWRVRNKRHERGFIWLGALAGAYGLRLLFSSDVFHFTATVDKAQRLKWSYPQWTVTYTLIPLAALFLREVFPEWDRILIRRITGLLVIFAGIAIAADLILHRYGSFDLPYNAVVVIGLVAETLAIPRRADGRYPRWVRGTGFAFIAAVLMENIWRLRSTSFPVRLQVIEGFIFACWLAARGAVMVERYYRRRND